MRRLPSVRRAGGQDSPRSPSRNTQVGSTRRRSPTGSDRSWFRGCDGSARRSTTIRYSSGGGCEAGLVTYVAEPPRMWEQPSTPQETSPAPSSSARTDASSPSSPSSCKRTLGTQGSPRPKASVALRRGRRLSTHRARPVDPEQLQHRGGDVQEMGIDPARRRDPAPARMKSRPGRGWRHQVRCRSRTCGLFVAADGADGAPEQIAEVHDQVGRDPVHLGIDVLRLKTFVPIGRPCSSGIAASRAARSSRTCSYCSGSTVPSGSRPRTFMKTRA